MSGHALDVPRVPAHGGLEGVVARVDDPDVPRGGADGDLPPAPASTARTARDPHRMRPGDFRAGCRTGPPSGAASPLAPASPSGDRIVTPPRPRGPPADREAEPAGEDLLGSAVGEGGTLRGQRLRTVVVERRAALVDRVVDAEYAVLAPDLVGLGLHRPPRRLRLRLFRVRPRRVAAFHAAFRPPLIRPLRRPSHARLPLLLRLAPRLHRAGLGPPRALPLKLLLLQLLRVRCFVPRMRLSGSRSPSLGSAETISSNRRRGFFSASARSSRSPPPPAARPPSRVRGAPAPLLPDDTSSPPPVSSCLGGVEETLRQGCRPGARRRR